MFILAPWSRPFPFLSGLLRVMGNDFPGGEEFPQGLAFVSTTLCARRTEARPLLSPAKGLGLKVVFRHQTKEKK